LQNNSTAAINISDAWGQGAARPGDETRRIEEQLGRLFEARGFRVVLNWHPPAETYPNAGEVDLICARDGIVLVMEIKSTFSGSHNAMRGFTRQQHSGKPGSKLAEKFLLWVGLWLKKWNLPRC